MEFNEVKGLKTSNNKRFKISGAYALGYIYVNFNKGYINREKALEQATPYLVSITTKCADSFYKSMNIGHAYNQFVFSRETQQLSYNDNEYFGLDDTIECFYKAINNFNFDLVTATTLSDKQIEDGYTEEDIEPLAFTRYFKTQLYGRLSNKQKKAKNNATILNTSNREQTIEFLSFDNPEVIKMIEVLSSDYDEEDFVFNIEIKNLLLEFAKSDYIQSNELRKAMLIELYYVLKDKHLHLSKKDTYVDAKLIATTYKVSEITIKRTRKDIKERFKALVISKKLKEKN